MCCTGLQLHISVQHAWEKARGSVLTVPLERKSILKLVAAARAGSSRVRASAMLPVYSGEVYSGYSGEVYCAGVDHHAIYNI